MNLLCDALQQNTIIDTIGFTSLPKQKPDLQLLVDTLHKMRGLHSLEINGSKIPQTALFAILNDLICPSCNIKGLSFKGIGYEYANMDLANQMQSILSENRKMNKLQHFSFRLDDFQSASKELIISTLKGTESLTFLEIKQFYTEGLHQLKGIIQDMPYWTRQCELKLICNEPNIELIHLLKYVRLEQFIGRGLSYQILDKIISEIPSWKFLTDLDFEFPCDELTTATMGSKFVNAIYKSSSLKNIAFFNGSFSEHVQNKVDEVLTRNERLNECTSSPEKVALTQWPELFELANPTGLNFSYVCIRKIPDIFVTLFYANVENDHMLSSGCNDE